MKSHVLAALSVIGLGAAFALTAVQPSSGLTAASHHTQNAAQLHFKLQRSSGAVAANCLLGASADVTVTPGSIADSMTISAHQLPPNQEFDVFVIQVPNAPFGVSWYQGDLESNAQGDATGHFRGRFSIETFAVAPGVAPAPVVFSGDGNQNVASPPIHEYHVGVWFGSPTAAAAAGCPTTVTPFNGHHNAGVQALSTKQFGDLRGPLRQVK
ncbi:MAG: hypothetical protein QOI51_1136 [Nocardioidaceae bacterium]|jgi:hypothetical protein|nr:hypothetical protein [Nocardioidaceae bacterium]MDX6307666.1 hypothetical protein [Nocardioidaceae bacterium]